jgi:hypothetical protein
VAQTGTAESFLSLSDDEKRLFFALAVDDSERRKRAELEIERLRAALSDWLHTFGSTNEMSAKARALLSGSAAAVEAPQLPSNQEVHPWELIRDKDVSQLVFTYEMVLTEMRTHARTARRGSALKEWVERLDRERDEFVKSMLVRPDETSELSRALHVIDEAGKLSDWINRARPVITELMEAYARLVRSHSGMGAMELAEVQPWRCMEYIGAEELLRAQPVAIVEITTEKATAPPSSTLADFGYAPGVYAFHCLDCDQEDLGDKRSIRCKPCAEKALAAQNGTGST